MAQLIVLNGSPASGKSTLAARLVATRALALNLDVDVLRGLLGGWTEQPHDAGLAARRLAIAMATAHLAEGHDVVVPQLLARATFLDELEAVAQGTGAQFIEIALVLERDEAAAAFAERSASPGKQQHRDAFEAVERAGGAAALDEMYSSLMAFLDTRPACRRVAVILGDIDGTLQLVESAIAEHSA